MRVWAWVTWEARVSAVVTMPLTRVSRDPTSASLASVRGVKQKKRRDERQGKHLVGSDERGA